MELIVLVLMILGTSIATCKVMQNWRYERKFYKSVNWDFEQDSGYSTRFGYGYKGEKISNRKRMAWGYPVSAAITFIVFVASIFVLVFSL